MSISCAVLMCHAPIVVPQVAGDRAGQCSRTTAAMTEVARRLVAHRPDMLVLISPHASRHARSWGLCTQSSLHGSFRRFGAAHVGLRMPGSPEAAAHVTRAARAQAVAVEPFEQTELDHGALVPLHFVHQAGFTGAVLLLSPPASHTESHEALGRALAQAAADSGQRWAILASGDMSHRLIPGAPCGFDPRAQHFDDKFVELIRQGDLRGAASVEPALRALAAEDVVDSVAVAAAAVDYQSSGHRVHSYEGPFGVGYLEATLFDSAASIAPFEDDAGNYAATADEPPWQQLLAIARAAIASHVSAVYAEGVGSSVAPLPVRLDNPGEPGNWNIPQGVFVTLRDRRGALRGCVGHVEPRHASLEAEVAACAQAAATRDTRFRPVTPHELSMLVIELSLLSAPEPVSDLTQLDPSRYGVIVSSGLARGVLLPDIAGVTTAQDQVRIAASKGRLPPDRPDQPWTIERFEVRKGAETVPLTTTRVGHA